MKGLLTVDEIKKLVEEYKDEAVELLQGAIASPSPTGKEEPMSQYMAGKMEDFGLEVRRVAYDGERANLLADWKGDENGKKFIFNGHMDVFPPNDGLEAKYGFWSGKLVDGKVYGRGSVDMKSGDCAALMAVRILKDKGYIPDGKVMLTYMVDEENNSQKGVLALIRDGLINDGDLGICMEPTNGMLKIRESGVWQVDITYTAQGGHTTNDNSGMDALKKAVLAINELYKLQKDIESRKVEGMAHPFFRINTIHAGNMSNTLASKSTFGFDRRFSASEPFDQVKAEIFGVLDKLKAENPEMDYQAEEIAFYPASFRDENDEYYKAIIDACEESRGNSIERLTSGGSSDSSHLIANTNIKMMLYGPGDCKYTGMADENVEVESYLAFIADYINVLNKTIGLTKK